jgi:endogenous inhibitor of DNA gyrase (YacG/DUF329 family)
MAAAAPDASARPCPECGRDLDAAGRTPSARFCSRTCQLAALNRRRTKADETGRHVERPCDRCGRTMVLARNRPCAMSPGCGGWHVLDRDGATEGACAG